MFVREGALARVQSTLVHETTHYIQDLYRNVYRSFYAEFQAYAMERIFLNRLAREARRIGISMPNTLPENVRWILHASDEDIANYII